VFDFSSLANSDLPPPNSRWTGFPEFHFVGGNNDPEGLPVEKIAEACDAVLRREGKTLATYFLHSGPQGYGPLREFLVDKLERYAGMSCTTDDILLTSGSLQAIDLINAALLSRGDTVIVEESNYGGVLSRCRQLGVNMVSVPVDHEGMQTDELSQTLDQLAQQKIKPRYIYTIPTVHNPTGTIMSLERRHALLELAKRHDIPVFEDECYADLVWDGTRPPALHALDDSGRVIHIGSFSKTIAPALRVGYIVANWSLLGQLLALKSDAGSGALEQMVLAEYCKDNFDTHVSNLNVKLKAKLDVLTQSIDQEFGSVAEYDYPPGGIFLWVTLPESVDTEKLASVAAAQGVAINPGHEWSLEEQSRRKLRLCFASPDADTIRQGMAKLAQVCFTEFGVPQYGANRERS